MTQHIHTADDPVIALGDLVLDPSRREVRRADVTIELTLREFELLRALMEHAGRVLSREALIDIVWDSAGVTRNVVDTYVSYIRRKLDGKAERPLIRTVRGIGYAFRTG